MKKTITMLCVLACIWSVRAQTPKKGQAKKTTGTTAKTASQSKPQAGSNASATTTATAKTEPRTTHSVAVKATDDDDYSTAIGLKLLYGWALTGKHFFNTHTAGEAIVRYRSYSGFGSEANISLLYEYHARIDGVDGLKWYGGGGAYGGYFHYNDDFLPAAGYSTTSTYFGISGVLGLEYKFKNAPIALSADWQPVFLITDYYNNSGFAAEGGGIGVKYTF